jgi:hypothetical protein
MKRACALVLVAALSLLALPLVAAAPAPAPTGTPSVAPVAPVTPATPAAPATLAGLGTPAPLWMIPCPIISDQCCKIVIRNGCRICTDYVTCHLN